MKSDGLKGRLKKDHTDRHELCEALAAARGLSLYWVSSFPDSEPMYDGTSFTVDTISNAIHEIAHWEVAAPQRRGMVNFALGADPEGGGLDEYVDPSVDDIWEECEASLLGILAERQLGMNWHNTWVLHNWDNPDTTYPVPKIYRGLVRRGLVSSRGEVSFLKDLV